eukprot:TRINITY_DN4342_c1_g1_i2.p1 TRINITY_DN4342_c1_g1~~TRINITY_DN4342_c1_g1_i2.p1  ORF type:complete len:465 (-),score=135.00 TRINITY_DN4342_c1_g1_i2:9-1403(-)
MESLEEQVAGIAIRVSKCEDQAGTVEEVLEKLNRLSESIDVLQGDNKSIREIEKNDVTEMKDMIDSLNAESRGILERVEDMDRMSTSNNAQQEVANRQNLGLLEESLLKHEENSAELDELKDQLDAANQMNQKLSEKLTIVSDKYEELIHKSAEIEERNRVTQQKQTELIEKLQERVKSLEAQLSNRSSPSRFTKSGEEFSRIENENLKLLKKIDQLEDENKELKEEMKDPVTDEEILDNSSDDEEPPLDSIILPKPIYSSKKTTHDFEVQLQASRDKLASIQALSYDIDQEQKSFLNKLAVIQSTTLLRKQENPRTPYVWLIDSVSMRIEQESSVYSEAFISDKSGHKIGAMLDFSMAKSSHNPSVGFYVTMLPGDNDKKLKWPFKGNFKLTLVNYSDNSKSRVRTFSDSGDNAFHLPLLGQNKVMFGIAKFISVSALTKPAGNRLYVKEDRMEVHIEVQTHN